MKLTTTISKHLFPWGRLFLMVVVFNLAPFPMAEIAVPQSLGWWQHFGLGRLGKRLVGSWVTIGFASFVSDWIEHLQTLMLGEGQSRLGFFFQGRVIDSVPLEGVLMAYSAAMAQASIWLLSKSVGLRVSYGHNDRGNFSVSDWLVLMTGIAVGLAVLKGNEVVFSELGRPTLDLPENALIAPWWQIAKLATVLAVVQFLVCLCVTFPATLFRLRHGKVSSVGYWARVCALGLLSGLVGFGMTSGEIDATFLLGFPAVVLAVALSISWVSKLDVEFSRNRIPVIRKSDYRSREAG